MKKTLFAVAILLVSGMVANAQSAKDARPKKAVATTQTTTVQKSEKSNVIVAENISEEQIRTDKIKAKAEAKRSAKKVKASADIRN